ncbi:glycoside hydrolase family 13 protein [Phycicoccus sp. MQZ13P-5]|uniref:Glycoside hydrolase family 13 protein n=1 Tax=Phycicoccus sonneratiae TaxID=2807628 RepID=A0ABS2CRG7_9MICO|nr:glycoside hydrolase family 13 protein [Phycicoccus sonneraticus]
MLRDAEPVDDRWWRDAVVYQVYPRSWASSGTDGVGDLPGILARLPYLAALGVDALWLSPFYVSPQHDAGYDVSDHRDVDPQFGTVADVERLVEAAHALGLRVVADVIPNHVSTDHPWFRAALADGPGAPSRERFVVRPGRGADGEEPPNNWRSEFGGPAWSRLTEPDGTPGPWYLHQFDSTQADVAWEHPEVVADFEQTLRFWLDRGLDGFRVDAAHCIVKAPGLPDQPPPQPPGADPEPTHLTPFKDQEGCHDVYREWRRLVDGYDPPRLLCAEAWVTPLERAMRYVRPDEMHQAFNLDFLDAGWDAGRLRRAVAETVRAADAVGASPTWALANHDTVRLASRLGLPDGTPNPNGKGLGPDQPAPDPVLGLRRARAAMLLMLALPGSAYLYQGEELGLPEATTLPDEVRRDPTFARTGGRVVGRDGCRVPMPWARDAPSLGFGAGASTWLPQPPEFAALAVDQQDGVAGSTLELVRAALAERRARGLGRAGLRLTEGHPDDVVALALSGTDGPELLVLTNAGTAPVDLPPGARVVLASGPLDGGSVPPDTTVWVLS